jgi:putative transposase
MIVLEFKAKGKTTQYSAIDEAIRTAQFVRNKCVRYWMDNRGVGQKELYRYNTKLRAESPLLSLKLSCLPSRCEKSYYSIARFYDNCKKSIPGKKGYPKFKKTVAQLSTKLQDGSFLKINVNHFIDKKGIGKLNSKDVGLHFIPRQIKRVVGASADGYYVQFLVNAENKSSIEPQGNVGLDVESKSSTRQHWSHRALTLSFIELEKTTEV